MTCLEEIPWTAWPTPLPQHCLLPPWCCPETESHISSAVCLLSVYASHSQSSYLHPSTCWSLPGRLINHPSHSCPWVSALIHHTPRNTTSFPIWTFYSHHVHTSTHHSFESSCLNPPAVFWWCHGPKLATALKVISRRSKSLWSPKTRLVFFLSIPTK